MSKETSIWFRPDQATMPLKEKSSPSNSSTHSSSWHSVQLQHFQSSSSESLLHEHTQPSISHLLLQWLRARFWRVLGYLVAVLLACVLIASIRPLPYLMMKTFSQPVSSGLSIPPECSSSSFPEPGWVFDTSRQARLDALAQQPTIDQIRARPQKYLQKQTAQTAMSSACADQWIGQSEVCEAIKQGTRPLPEEEIDMAWSFVIPTDHWSVWKDYYQAQSPGESGVKRDRFRYYDQLRYSIRSVFQYAPFLRRGHLISASLPATLPEDANTSCHVVQTPPWLNTRTVQAEDSKLKVVPHHQLFAPATGQPDLDNWHDTSLPNFNSLAIESQLHRLPASTLLYFNDDFYLGRRLAPSDIASLLLGPTFRFDFRLFWMEAVSDEELAHHKNRHKHGRYTTKFLEQRFGRRKRHWPAHFAYVMNVPVGQEVAYIWPDVYQETSETRFRDHGNEICATLFEMHYMIEKHREALLWSFIVAASDKDGSGEYSYEERKHMQKIIGGEQKGSRIHVREPLRAATLEGERYYEKQLQAANIEKPRETHFQWSSQDGYPFLGPIHSLPLQLTGSHKSFCRISLDKCFGTSNFFETEATTGDTILTSEELFRNMAFRHPVCGDCLMVALLGKSGPLGLSAFLPESDSMSPVSRAARRRSSDEVPFVGGLSRDWVSADFSLKSAIGENWNAREFSVRLIQRYSYTIGKAPGVFWQIRDSESTYKALDKLLRSPPALLALNDAMGDRIDGVETLNQTFQAWQRRAFSKKLEYEF